MRNLMQKIAVFMQGRYGTDKLNNSLFVLFLVLWVINAFVFHFWTSVILDVLELAVIGLIVFRSLSRNITKRSAENRRFLPIYNKITMWAKLNIRKFKERKEYKYLKCPVCKAQLRVKNRKGEHRVRCPKCRNEFNKKI